MSIRRLLSPQKKILYLYLFTATIIINNAISSSILAHTGVNNKNVISVRLFEAYRPLPEIQILPPFDLLLPDRCITIVTLAKARVEHGKICLRKNDPQALPIILSANKLCLSGHNGKPLLLTMTVGKAPRQYRGNLLLSLDPEGCLDIINKVALPDYIEGVVTSEAPLSAPVEMLKAQAILAQTIISYGRSTHIIGDSTQSQCYLGSSLCSEKSRAAVLSVKGQQLCYKGLPIMTYYHSTCAGGTSNGATYFHLAANKLPYVSAVVCQHCRNSPFWKTTTNRIPHDLFAKEFGSSLPTIIKCDKADRPLLVELSNGEMISGYDFWIRLGRAFGWDKAPGTRFKLLAAANGDCIIESTGAGHGVGLCQWGAAELAKEGKTNREILRYYFPACEVL